jgi:hypothetical protein
MRNLKWVAALLAVATVIPMCARRQSGRASSTLPPVTSADWERGKFADFTKDELADMARRCELRWQVPRASIEKYRADTIRTNPDDDPAATHRRLARLRAGEHVELSGSRYERWLIAQLDESEHAHDGPKFTLTGCDSAHALFRSQH